MQWVDNAGSIPTFDTYIIEAEGVRSTIVEVNIEPCLIADAYPLHLEGPGTERQETRGYQLIKNMGGQVRGVPPEIYEG